MQHWFNNPEISAQNREALEIFGEAARIGTDYSVRLWEKQAEVARSATDRALTRALSSGGAAQSPEAAAKFGKEAGEAEFAEFQRAAREYCDIAAEAGEALLGVAEKGRTALTRNFGDAMAKGATAMPPLQNGQGPATADMVQKTLSTANEMFANGLQFAYKAMRTGMEGMRDSAGAPFVPAADGSGASADGGDGGKPSGRGRRARG